MNKYSDINLAIVGCGKWGMNHVKTAYKLLGDNLKAVYDLDTNLKEKIKAVSPSINLCPDISLCYKNEDINCVIVATPAETHYSITKTLLNNGKHVLVEKPMTLHSVETNDLLHISDNKNLILMSGHILLYHPAVVKIKEMINDGKIGKVQYIYSNRLNLGTIRSEENILWSFAPHDISIVQYLLDSFPIRVNAYGAKYLQPGIEDTTITILNYPGNINVHIFVSWLHPFKEQRFVVIGDKGMIVFEDSAREDKLKYYEKGFAMKNGVLLKFESDYEVISYPDLSPLEEEQKHFFDCILNNNCPLSDGKHTYDVLKILEMAASQLLASD
ncbi:gfo/Idh/MocA family oxidoreductase [bacterium]|nr:MAG: gfo/Idh/MocA family oxidoreductase [bacterium]